MVMALYEFQFLHGTIKSSISKVVSITYTNFNSFMVQLKETVCGIVNSICARFQFLHGTIKSVTISLRCNG